MQDAVDWGIRLDALRLTRAAAVPRVNRVKIFTDDDIQYFIW
jgi:hypothetical protein